MRFQEIQERCWTGYQQQGMKKKGNRQVPNCVPVEEVKTGPEITGKDLLFKAAAMAMLAASQEGISLDYEQAIRQASKLYGIPYRPSELPRLLAQRQEIDRQLSLLKQGKQVAKQRRQEKRAPTPANAEEYWRTHALPTDRIKPASKTLEETEAGLAEDLKKWFKEKWVRFGPDGKIRGDCARGSSGEGKPKCLPQAKAQALGKKGRAAAAAKKRREDPNPERRGAAKNVATKVREEELDEACWKGYHKEGMKTMFGKKYPNCVKNKKTNENVAEGERVARKPGQPANSKQHSDLYTDENPKGTITGLKFATVEDARASVSKIRASGKSHAHKIQAAVAMEQRARAAGKSSAAAVYRRYIDANKKTNEQISAGIPFDQCPSCGGAIVHKSELTEKQDACYHKVKSRYKVWPSAYASGALVQCRKKGAANWGNKGK